MNLRNRKQIPREKENIEISMVTETEQKNIPMGTVEIPTGTEKLDLPGQCCWLVSLLHNTMWDLLFN